ncbi:MAG: hypothetical protein HYR56_02150 [Acidobacteria bacterium]|nr:hypothetical protein [Acidobacteriota bacterium]MBI3421925.1 hypothetical protein [Acidobacteriota bacterium]
MSQASTLSQIVFLLLVAFVAGCWWIGQRQAAADSETAATTNRWTRNVLFILLVWLAVPAALALSGWLHDFTARPPRFPLLLVSAFLLTTWLAFSSYGTRLIEGLPIGWLIGFQVFRLPLEWLLHRLYQENVVPVQMTYAGRNFDIITGTLALLLLLWSKRTALPHWALWAFNLIGLALLINIVTIALLSAPLPLRRFFNEPANTFIADWPWVWLPAFLVQAAWFGHLLVFRRLRRMRSTKPLPFSLTDTGHLPLP